MGPLLIVFSLFFLKILAMTAKEFIWGHLRLLRLPKGQIMIMRAKNRILTFTTLPSPPLQENVPNMQYFPLYCQFLICEGIAIDLQSESNFVAKAPPPRVRADNVAEQFDVCLIMLPSSLMLFSILSDCQ